MNVPTQKKPTFILADETGSNQLALVSGSCEEAQAKASTFAVNRGAPVMLFTFMHIGTFLPLSATEAHPQDPPA